MEPQPILAKVEPLVILVPSVLGLAEPLDKLGKLALQEMMGIRALLEFLVLAGPTLVGLDSVALWV